MYLIRRRPTLEVGLLRSTAADVHDWIFSPIKRLFWLPSQGFAVMGEASSVEMVSESYPGVSWFEVHL